METELKPDLKCICEYISGRSLTESYPEGHNCRCFSENKLILTVKSVSIEPRNDWATIFPMEIKDKDALERIRRKHKLSRHRLSK